MKKLAWTILFFLLACSVYGKDCSCENNFAWVKKIIEENDAGFHYVLEAKGRQAYEAYSKGFYERTKAETDLVRCTTLLNEWLGFFRSGHIGIRLNENQQTASADPQPFTELEATGWDTHKIDLTRFKKYLQTKKEADYEGIWEIAGYTIGIKREGSDYIGFITESAAENWKVGQVKLKLISGAEGMRSVFYLRDRSAEESEAVALLGNNYLKIGERMLTRRYPSLPPNQQYENYFKAMNAKVPYLEELDQATLYLRIPSFEHRFKKAIDSVISANRDHILRTENLIIDIRNGTGGSDVSYHEILPFLYTNPIRTVGVEYYSTKLNNQRMLDFINDPSYGFDDTRKKWAKEAYDTLEQQLGRFVNLNASMVSVTSYDTVYTFPKHVGIIINEGNGSTDEQFLLAAKQSRKVKLFGTTTYGVLDISNMYFVQSPCQEFSLGYSLTRSMRLPGMAIDGKGIQPDYYLDKSISPYEWVPFVSDVLKGQ